MTPSEAYQIFLTQMKKRFPHWDSKDPPYDPIDAAVINSYVPSCGYVADATMTWDEAWAHTMEAIAELTKDAVNDACDEQARLCGY